VGRDATGVTRHRWLLGLGALLSGAAIALCLLVPLYDADEGGSGVPGATLVEVNGRGVLLPLALFGALAAGAWLAPSRRVRVIAAGGHTLLTLLALVSIGTYFLPASGLLVAGAAVDLRRPRANGHDRQLVHSA
jgi:hypothetical protein